MLHLNVEVIENFEGLKVICSRKYATGETRHTKIYKKEELEAMGDEEAKWNDVHLLIADSLTSLRKDG